MCTFEIIYYYRDSTELKTLANGGSTADFFESVNVYRSLFLVSWNS